MEFSPEPKAFAEQISSGNLTSEQILIVLDAHKHSGFRCSLCDYISEGLYAGYLPEYLISQNPGAVNAEVIDSCLECLATNYEFNQGGYEEGVAVRLSTNPNSSARALRAGASHMEVREIIETRFEGKPYPEEDFEDQLRAVSIHPLADEIIFREWLAAGHNPRAEVDEPLHSYLADSCPTCLAYLEEIWKAR